MTGIARADRYPQPGPVSAVLSELHAGYCEHDGVPARCPSCRAAAPPPDVPDVPDDPEPAPQPSARPVQGELFTRRRRS